jgi:SNF2 family DNA or RNA helicase
MELKHLAVQPYPHQIKGIQWMIQSEQTSWRKGGILADDMGLGKSFQTIATIVNSYFQEGTTLIVVPLALLQQWKQEISNKVTCSIRIGVYHGNTREKMQFQDYDVVITTYACLQREQSTKATKATKTPYQRPGIGRLIQFQWLRVVLDECQNIKNKKSAVAVAAISLVSKFKWALSGTPIQNSLKELDTLKLFLFGNLASRVHSGFILRRLKENVLDLPKKTEHTIYVQFSAKETEIYNQFFSEAQDEIQEILAERKAGFMSSIFVVLMRMRQLADDYRLVVQSPHVDLRKGSKVQQILNVIRMAVLNKEKIVVFSHFVAMLEIIQKECSEQQIPLELFHGSMTQTQRNHALVQFQTQDTNVLLMSTKAGNVGLNLVQATHVVITEPWWNPFVDDQAMDRVFRIGQQKPVHIHKFVAFNSIEHKIIQLQQQKRSIFARIFGNDQKNQYIPQGSTGTGGVRFGVKDIAFLFQLNQTIVL